MNISSVSQISSLKQVDLTIIVVSFEVRELIARCLVSLQRACKNLETQIIIVDNASRDDSAQFICEHFSQITLIANEKNVGFAKANNQGLALARGRYYLLLNPDTEFAEKDVNALELLIKFMDAHPRAGACGPSLFFADGTRQHSAFRFPTLAQIYIDLFPVNWRLRESRWNGRYPFSQYDSKIPFEIDHPLGAALMVRAETASQVGLLDESFFIYAEEVDWCMRIKRAGWQIWCVPEANIIHHEARSTRQFRERMFVELWKARFTLFEKHYSRLWNSAARALVRAGMRRAIRLAQQAGQSGSLKEAELEARLAAYTAVLQLAADAE